jgi:hypothetical protein
VTFLLGLATGTFLGYTLRYLFDREPATEPRPEMNPKYPVRAPYIEDDDGVQPVDAYLAGFTFVEIP